MIVCVRIPHFITAVERQARGLAASVPLLIGHDTRVAGVCPLTAAHGIQIGMTLRHALALCPAAQVFSVVSTRYGEAADDLTALLGTFAGRVELERSEAGLVDSAGAAQWLLDVPAPSAQAAMQLVELIRAAFADHVGLAPAIGVASTRFTARCVAKTLVPPEADYVAAGHEAGFLASLTIDYLPLDAELHSRLRMLGLTRLGQIAMLPSSALLNQFGAVGRLLQALAQGRDVDPIQPYIPTPALTLRRIFDGPVMDARALQLTAQTLGQQLATRLQRRGYAARRVRLQLEQEDLEPWVNTLVLEAPTAQVAPLQRALQHLLQRAHTESGIETMEATCGDLTPVVVQQLDLFGHAAAASQRQELLTNLVARFGARRFFQAVPQQRDASLPERRYQLQELRAS